MKINVTSVNFIVEVTNKVTTVTATNKCYSNILTNDYLK